MSARSCISLLGLLATTWAAAQHPAVAQDEKKDTRGEAGRQEAPTFPNDPEFQAWLQAAAPNENHERLNYMIGEWDCTVRMWQRGMDEPMMSKGRTTNKWILGKRYVATEYEGDFMGMPFSGLGITGYDNINKRYFSHWLDTLSTGAMIEHGSYDEATKTYTFKGETKTPDGGTLRTKSTIEVKGKDEHVITMYHHGPDAEDFEKVMEIVYVRATPMRQTPEAGRPD